jgi:hypothetical protein
MDSDLKKFEAELERLSPMSLPEGLISRMEAAMEGWEEGSGQVSGGINKVVPFPQRMDEEDEEAHRGGSWWAAAACVALLGAVAAMVITADLETNSADRPVARVVKADAVRSVEFAPQSAKRMILDASDQNVFLDGGSQPMRLMRLNYVDRVVFRNAAGEEVHLEVPSVNYRLVPVPTD